MLDWDAWLKIFERPFNKSVKDVRKSFQKLKKSQKAVCASQICSSCVLERILPFSSKVNQIICSCLSDRKTQVEWKTCLSSCTLVVRGSINEKFSLIFDLFSLVNPSRNALNMIIQTILIAVHKILKYLDDVSGYSYDMIDDNFEMLDSDEMNDLIDTILQSNQKVDDSLTRIMKPTKFEWNPIRYEDARTVPCCRAKHACCRVNNKIYLYGGRDGSYPLSDLWVYDLVTEIWSPVEAFGENPGYLEEHSIVEYSGLLYVFGGLTRLPCDEDTPLWIYDTEINRWRHWTCDSEVLLPPCLKGHSAVTYYNRMYIFGGAVELAGAMDNLWCFDFDSSHWHLIYSQTTGIPGPSARQHHTCTVHNDDMYLLGGVCGLISCTDMWKYNFCDNHWTKIKLNLSLPELCAHTATLVGSSLLVIGGEDNSNKSLWEFKIGSNMWTSISNSLSNGPQGKSFHSTLLIPLDSFTVSTDRTFSVPIQSSCSNYELVSSDRPSSCPQRGSSTVNRSSTVDRFSSRVHPVKNPSKTVTVKPISRPDVYVHNPRNSSNSYYAKTRDDVKLLREDSKESVYPFTFDNYAISRSLDSICSNSMWTEQRVYQRNRSLESIQDVHNTAVLPGSVNSEESLHTICTVRNVVLDDPIYDKHLHNTAVYTNTKQHTLSYHNNKQYEIPHEQTSASSDTSASLVPVSHVYLMVLGGKNRGFRGGAILPISSWRCKLHVKSK